MDYSVKSDEILVEYTIHHDNSAYEELVKRHMHEVIGTAYMILRDEFMAQDIAQEAFVSCYFNLENLREREKFGAWVRRTAKNKALNLIRNRRDILPFDVMINSADTSSAPESRLLMNEQNHRIHSALNSLPPKLAQTATLYYINEVKQEKIAEITNTPLGTVKRRLHDARKILREVLSDMDNTFAKNISERINELNRYYSNHEYSFDGYENFYNETLKLVESLPESDEKKNALAQVYFSKASFSKDENDMTKAREAAEKSGNIRVLTNIWIDDILNKEPQEMIDIIESEYLPKILESDDKSARADIQFWRGASYHKLGNYKIARECMNDVINQINNVDKYSITYCVNDMASLKLIDFDE